MSPWIWSALFGEAYPWLVALVSLVGVLAITSRRRLVTTRVAGPHAYRDLVTVSTSTPSRSSLVLSSAGWILATLTVLVTLPHARGVFVAGAIVQGWVLLGLVHGPLCDEESVPARAVVSALVSVAWLLGTMAVALDTAARLDTRVEIPSVVVPLLTLAHAVACVAHAARR